MNNWEDLCLFQLICLVDLCGIGGPNILGRTGINPPNCTIKKIKSLADSITNSFVKELKNAGTKKLNKDILADAEPNKIGKKFKK